MRQAFSLVELSIVLVILGLLTGGILTGQNLIRAAELRSVATDFQRYQTAIQSFRDKYFAIPGDMRNATDFWGTVATCPTTAGTGTQTCNGDGDGLVENAATSNRFTEAFMLWQHLANAGMVEGNYNGRAGSVSALDTVAGVNVPVSKLGGGTWLSYYLGNITASPYAFAANYGHVMALGTELGANSGNGGPIFSPQEAWGIDKKMDDGKPAHGKIKSTLASNPLTPDCTTSDTASAEYNLTRSDILCVFSYSNVY
jgi:prepilin-type N-terminal cleavage/methylation domain-containing protein